MNYLVICFFLLSKINVVDYVYLEGFDFVDDFDSIEFIDILIGFDYYWDFVIGDFIKGEYGLIVVDSKFGWLLFGLIYDLLFSNVVVFNLIIFGECNSMFGG